MKVRTALATAAVVAATVAAPAPAQAAASCEFQTYQYVVTGETVSLWNYPQGSVRATLYRGDIFNSGIAPNAGGGWLIGNAYTPGRQFIGSGMVLRGWTSYTGTHFC